MAYSWVQVPRGHESLKHNDFQKGWTMKKLFCAVIATVGLLFNPIPAQANPGQCQQGFAGGNGGGFCDGPIQRDGTFYHCETVYVMGFGGTNCFYVRPVPTDVDPRGWQPV